MTGLAIGRRAPWLLSKLKTSAPLLGNSQWHRVVAFLRPEVCLTLCFYGVQGIILGVAAAMPTYMQANGASLSEHALFSLSTYANALKVVVAPIVDSLYAERFGLGRRKSWIVLSQLCAGLLLLTCGALTLGHSLSTSALASCFFVLHVLVAVHDIAVDAWAISLLGRQRAAYAPFCNSAGQTLGWFVSYVMMAALESPSFCDGYVRRLLGWVPAGVGFIAMGGRMQLCGACLLLFGIVLWVSKKEQPPVGEVSTAYLDSDRLQPAAVQKSTSDAVAPDSDVHACTALVEPAYDEHPIRAKAPVRVMEAYRRLISIAMLRPVLVLSFILITNRLGFVALDSTWQISLQRRGISAEQIALVEGSFTPLHLIAQGYISKYMVGKRPLDVFARSFPMHIAVDIGCLLALCMLLPLSPAGAAAAPILTVFMLYTATFVRSMLSASMYFAQTAFCAQVADPALTGTFLALTSAVGSFGLRWPRYFILRAIDMFSGQACTLPSLACGDASLDAACLAAGGVCVLGSDGLVPVVLAGAVFSLLWYRTMGGRLRALQEVPKRQWAIQQ